MFSRREKQRIESIEKLVVDLQERIATLEADRDINKWDLNLFKQKFGYSKYVDLNKYHKTILSKLISMVLKVSRFPSFKPYISILDKTILFSKDVYVGQIIEIYQKYLIEKNENQKEKENADSI